MKHLLLQNPMQALDDREPSRAHDASGDGLILIAVVALYAFAFWLIFKGPMQHWAAENKGAAAMLLTFGPGLVIFLFIALSR